LESLLGEIKTAVFDFHKLMQKDNGLLDMDLVKPELVKLKLAIDSFNAADMDDAVNNLLKLTQGNDIHIAVRQISDHILMSNFDEAAALIKSLF
jgi:hypothetical protein